MQKTAQYWLIGCGFGCVLILLGIAGLIAGGAFVVRDTVKGFEAAVESRDELEERYGVAADFIPWSDGAIPAARMEAFLAVREAGAAARQALVENFAALPTSEEEAKRIESEPFFEKMGSIFDVTKAGLGFGSSIGGLFDSRNRALLENEMGLGEYTYIYVLAYYVTGDHPVGESGEGLPMPNSAAPRLYGDLLQMLHQQLESLPADAEAAWRERLQAEVGLLEEDSDRFPWEDDPPAEIVASIEPFRERLEANYLAAANPFELGRNESRGSWSFTVE